MSPDQAPEMTFNRGVQVGFVMGSALVSMLLAAIWPSPVHAENVALRVFGTWERVKPETILQPVPVVHYQPVPLGSVGKFVKTEIEGCPIYEQNKVVGWSMTCGVTK